MLEEALHEDSEGAFLLAGECPTSSARLVNSELDCSKFKYLFGYGIYSWQDSLREITREISNG